MKLVDSTDHSFWKDNNFIKLWCGTVCSALGSSIYFILVAWYIVDTLGSERALANALLSMSLPRLFFMLTGGVFADRINRKLILATSAYTRGLIITAFSLFLWLGDPRLAPAMLYLTSTCFGIVDAFFWPARNSIMPLVVDTHQLAKANSLLETAQQLSTVMGPLLASALLPLASYPLMFLAIALIFVASGFFVSTLTLKPVIIGNVNLPVEGPLTELKKGLLLVKKMPSIIVLLVVTFCISLVFQGPINIGLPTVVKARGWTGSTYGLFEGFWGVGAVCGGLVTLAANSFQGRFKLLPAFIACLGLSFVGLGYLPNVPSGIVAMFAMGLFWTMANIPAITYIQTTVDPNLLGRVMSLLTLTTFGLGPISYALTSMILESGVLSPPLLMKISGLIIVAVGIVTIVSHEYEKMESNPLWTKSKTAKL